VSNPRITRIEWARLEGQRPRPAGSNARLGPHGGTVRPSVARVTCDDGSTGIGPARLTREQATAILGQRLDALLLADEGAAASVRPDAALGDSWISLEYPLWDLATKMTGVPVYALAASVAGRSAPPAPFRVRCYDTSLYIDDLDVADDGDAAALIADEARQGYERGHRHCKIKVGRGARHMPLEQGTRRDIAVIRAVRAAMGSDAIVMIDANNGYNLNLAKRVLLETADCALYWLEEAFHEDAVLYRNLREWMGKQGLSVLIADGEGQASPSLLAWAREGIVDVVQYDVHAPGFTRWLEVGKQIDTWGGGAAPHHYGGFFGNFTSGHLAAAIRGFVAIEWDEASVPGIDTSRYQVREGWVELPNVPGFGIDYDEDMLTRAFAETGFVVSL
jgi:L-alanine-DL-glutamate epimerase-like enolase superfamily enzyme